MVPMTAAPEVGEVPTGVAGDLGGVLRSLVAQARGVVEGLDPEAVPARQATVIWDLCGELAGLFTGAQMLMARRVAAAGDYKAAGARDTAELLALRSGTSKSQMAQMLATSQRLAHQPVTETAVRQGALSAEQAHAVASVAGVDLREQQRLVDYAQGRSLKELRDEAQRARAVADPTPEQTRRRQIEERCFRQGTGADGRWWFRGEGPPEDRARFEAALNPFIETSFRHARKEGRKEPRDALAYDGLQALARHAHHNPSARTNPHPADEPHDEEENSPGHGRPGAGVTGKERSEDEAEASSEHSGAARGGGHKPRFDPNDPDPAPPGGGDGAPPDGADLDRRRHGNPNPAGERPGDRGDGCRHPEAANACDGNGSGADDDSPGDERAGASNGRARPDEGGFGPPPPDVAPGSGHEPWSEETDPDGPRSSGEHQPDFPHPGRTAADGEDRTAARGDGDVDGGRRRSPAAGRRKPTLSLLPVLRLDLATLQRGYLLPGELCEITSNGPLTLTAARELLGESVIKLVLTRHGQVRTVAHVGRASPAPTQQAILHADATALAVAGARDAVAGDESCHLPGVGVVDTSVARRLLGRLDGVDLLDRVLTRGRDVATLVHVGRQPTVAQRTALLWAQPTCSVQGCAHTFTQIDHRHEWHKQNLTELANLDRLCAHHHRLKTHQNYQLVPGTGDRPFVPRTDSRHPDNQPLTAAQDRTPPQAA